MRHIIIIAIVIVVGLGAVIHTYDNSVTVTNEPVATTTVEVLPEWAEDEDAVEAAKDVIRRKELQTELDTLQSEVTERESRIEEIEKELGVY